MKFKIIVAPYVTFYTIRCNNTCINIAARYFHIPRTFDENFVNYNGSTIPEKIDPYSLMCTICDVAILTVEQFYNCVHIVRLSGGDGLVNYLQSIGFESL